MEAAAILEARQENELVATTLGLCDLAILMMAIGRRMISDSSALGSLQSSCDVRGLRGIDVVEYVIQDFSDSVFSKSVRLARTCIMEHWKNANWQVYKASHNCDKLEDAVQLATLTSRTRQAEKKPSSAYPSRACKDLNTSIETLNAGDPCVMIDVEIIYVDYVKKLTFFLRLVTSTALFASSARYSSCEHHNSRFLPELATDQDCKGKSLQGWSQSVLLAGCARFKDMVSSLPQSRDHAVGLICVDRCSMDWLAPVLLAIHLSAAV